MLVDCEGFRDHRASPSHNSNGYCERICPPYDHCSVDHVLHSGELCLLIFLHSRMVGVLKKWPDWPEFTKENGETGDDLVGYKKAIITKYGKDSLIKSWLRVCKELASVTNNIAAVGSEAIPDVQFSDLFDLAADKKQELKDTGCFIVRQVVSQEQANEWFEDLKGYVAKNRSSINGKLLHLLVVKSLSLTKS